MTISATTTVPAAHVPTRVLISCGAAAGPLWVTVSWAQALTRDGFVLTRHPFSALSTGALGWIQITTFIVSGVLLLAGGTGLRRAMRGTRGGRWAPRLTCVAGLGLIAAGLLVMDPMDGFPAGTPAGMPAGQSWHSYGHMAAGSVTFTALIAACFVLARHFAAAGRRGRVAAAVIAGSALLVGNLYSGTGGPAGALVLAVGATMALMFVSATAACYRS